MHANPWALLLAITNFLIWRSLTTLECVGVLVKENVSLENFENLDCFFLVGFSSFLRNNFSCITRIIVIILYKHNIIIFLNLNYLKIQKGPAASSTKRKKIESCRPNLTRLQNGIGSDICGVDRNFFNPETVGGALNLIDAVQFCVFVSSICWNGLHLGLA